MQGISARISFTNHLIGSSNIQGDRRPDPAAARPAACGSRTTGRLRLELQSDNGDAQVVVNNGSFWIYDPARTSSTRARCRRASARQARASADKRSRRSPRSRRDSTSSPSTSTCRGAIPGDVAGQAAYTVRVSPKHDGGLLGSLQLAWDAVRGRAAAVRDLRARPELARCSSSRRPTSPTARSRPRTSTVSPPAGCQGRQGRDAVPAALGRRTLRSRHAAQARMRVHGAAAVASAAAVQARRAAHARRPAAPRSVTLLDMGGDAGGAGHLRPEPRRDRRDRAGRAAGAGQQLQGDRHRRAEPADACRSTAPPAHELDTALGTVVHVHPRRRRLHGARLGAAGRGRHGGAGAMTRLSSAARRARRRSRCAGSSSATAS